MRRLMQATWDSPKLWLLIGIFIFGLLLRTIDLSNHPAGFTPDEASFGYDAYSLYKTGKDQWGKSFPLVLESFGDGKMPLYSYLAIPFVVTLGLNETAVRLPNALIGSLAILSVYMLVLYATKRQRAALVASFLLAISPWGIAMSRGAFEANVTVLLLPLALYFYLKGKTNTKYLVVAVVLALINMFSYHTGRLVTPIVFGILVAIDWKSFKKDKYLWASIGLAAFALLVVTSTYLGGAGSRIASSSIFSLTGSDQRYLTTLAGSPDIFGKVFYNRATYLGATFIRNYLSYFSPQFLFVNGAAEATYGMIPGKALLYLPELVFLGGFIFLLFKDGIKKYSWLLVWILASVIPASLTIGPGFAANRAVVLLPALVVASGIGTLAFKNIKIVWSAILLLLVSFIFALHSYWYLQPVQGAQSMIFGAKQIVNFVNANDDYQRVIVSKKLSEPHIYFAFFSKTDPVLYQSQAQSWNYKGNNLSWVDQLPHYKLDNIEFKNFDWKNESKSAGTNTLFIGTPEDFNDTVDPIHKIYSPTGKELYWFVKGKESEK